MKEQLLERFLRYTAYHTTSDADGTTYPSTARQLRLLSDIASELAVIGCQDVAIDEYGYVTATIPASVGCQDEPVIGFLAHVDTSPDISGENVHPIVVENYDSATPLQLGVSDYYLTVEDFEELALFNGHTLITTDGTTLLGADDKAGVAAIVTAAQYLIENPSKKHGKIRLGFTPDEEIGRGVDHFSVKQFGANFAYTVDSGGEGCLEWENFNAASATVEITGRNFHPGYAKGKMVNALTIGCAINAALPAAECPEMTEGRQGFFHLHSMVGHTESATLKYIIRDHNRADFEARKALMASIVAAYDCAKVEIVDQYYNMGDIISSTPEIVERARLAIIAAGAEPIITAIRGGTDGARLSYMGLLCPNIFTGGMNPHSRFEYASLDSMLKATHTIIFCSMPDASVSK